MTRFTSMRPRACCALHDRFLPHPLGPAVAFGRAEPAAAGAAPPPAPGLPPRRHRFALPARAESVPEARHRVRERLAGWGADEETRDTAALVVTELFTNAVLHTGSGSVVCEVREEREKTGEAGEAGEEAGRRGVEVCGRHPGAPAPHARLPEEEHGRGLLLVEAASLAWGIRDVRGCGWSVWARLPLTAAAC